MSRTVNLKTTLATLLLSMALAVAARAGYSDSESASAATVAGAENAGDAEGEWGAVRGASTVASAKRRRRGTRIVLSESEFGRILVDSREQAIYIFENDSKGRSNCYGECAAAWPPVLTKGKPRAGKGVRSKRLGTIERRDGGRQVTYAGKPLYYYAHESPGQILCHNVDANGGFWWVIGPNGKRRP